MKTSQNNLISLPVSSVWLASSFFRILTRSWLRAHTTSTTPDIWGAQSPVIGFAQIYNFCGDDRTCVHAVSKTRWMRKDWSCWRRSYPFHWSWFGGVTPGWRRWFYRQPRVASLGKGWRTNVTTVPSCNNTITIITNYLLPTATTFNYEYLILIIHLIHYGNFQTIWIDIAPLRDTYSEAFLGQTAAEENLFHKLSKMKLFLKLALLLK